MPNFAGNISYIHNTADSYCLPANSKSISYYIEEDTKVYGNASRKNKTKADVLTYVGESNRHSKARLLENVMPFIFVIIN